MASLDEELTFGRNLENQSELVYTKTRGEGYISNKGGYWKFNEDESSIIMQELDEDDSLKTAVSYKIIKLTTKKLILQEEGDTEQKVYNSKY